jgi:hypothetical protein
MNQSHAHIVAIRVNGVLKGHQLRINGGGPGQSAFFGASKYGSPERALLAAERRARELGLPPTQARGGSTEGRLMRTSATGVAGIRFEWSQRESGPVLRVIATWNDKLRRSCSTSYSVERNGLGGALDKAIAARTSCGAPMPDRKRLMTRLRKAFRTA